MTVYELKNKDLKKEFKAFAKGVYGKVVFCLAYAIPFLSLIVSAELFIISRVCGCAACYRTKILAALCVTFVSFILGSRYFYKEFRKFYEATHRE